MSDGPKPVHPGIKRLDDAWQDGYYDRHGDHYRGLYRVGEGQGSWLGVLVLLLVGLVAGVLMWALVSGAATRGHKAFLWKRGREERDAATLERMWKARFGRAIPEALLAEIDDEGRGWTLDGKANFHLRMTAGPLGGGESGGARGVDYTPDAKAVRMLADMQEQFSP